MSRGRTIALHDHRSDHHRKAGAVLIYVLGNQEETWVKVGKSADIKRRMNELRGSAPDGTERVFLAGVWGMDSDERYIHNYFEPHRATDRSREYFNATTEVKDWLRWLRHQYYVATDIDQVALLERVSSGEWLPGRDRRMAPPQQLPLGTWGDLDLPAITGDDYYTSPKIIAAARDTMGSIDLDPASHPAANQVVRATAFWTVQTNGLDKEWYGNVWCNPPFNQWGLWGRKIMSEVNSGRVNSCCVLMANRSMSTLSASALFDRCNAICQTRGRIPFWGPKATSGPDDGHVILYFGPEVERFAACFAAIGPVLRGVAYAHKET